MIFFLTKQCCGGATKLKRQWAPFNSFNVKTPHWIQSSALEASQKPQGVAKADYECNTLMCAHTHWGAKALVKLHLWLYRAVKRRRIINAQGFKQTRGLSLAWMCCGLVGVCVHMCVWWLWFELQINKLLIGLLGIGCEVSELREH